MHPQLDELRDTIGRFLTNPEASLEVHCPDRRLSVHFTHVAVLARPRRSLSPQLRMVPRLVVSEPADDKALRRAENMGFSRTARETYHPKHGKMSIPLIEARFVNADEGADWFLAALQDVHGIGQSWLWITDLDFDNWPDPLPKPEAWPPAG